MCTKGVLFVDRRGWWAVLLLGGLVGTPAGAGAEAPP